MKIDREQVKHLIFYFQCRIQEIEADQDFFNDWDYREDIRKQYEADLEELRRLL